ncbi:MAG: MATE family efflux transporter [Bacteroidota bacterium]
MSIIEKVQTLLKKGDARTAKAKRHILYSFIVKGMSMVISLFLVRMMVGVLSKEVYGVWIVLFNVVGWFQFFDIGLDNGLRNKFAESLAEGNREKARIYLSTTLALMAIVAGGMLVLLFGVGPFLDWNALLGVKGEMAQIIGQELTIASFITFAFFFLNFVIKIIKTVLLADQRPSVPGLLNMLTNLLVLGLLGGMMYTARGSLVELAVIVGAMPLVVQGVAWIYFFAKDYKDLIPTPQYVRFSYTKDLVSLGFKFFVIQVIGVVLFLTDTRIIIEFVGGDDSKIRAANAALYSTTHKYFALITQAFGIITTPFWSAYTEAFQKKEWDWIKRTNKNLVKVWYLTAAGSIFALLLAPFVIEFLLEGDMKSDWQLNIFMLVFVLVLAYGSIFVMFVNGVGKVRLQMISSIIGGVINIPLSIFLANECGLGLSGVIIASILCMLYGAVLGPIQFNKIVNGTAKGIWDK